MNLGMNVVSAGVPQEMVLMPLSRIDEARQFLVFTLKGETLAIDIPCIREIIDFVPPAQFPLMPRAILNVINLRGVTVPIVDLSARLGYGRTRVGRRTCVVIVELEPHEGWGMSRSIGIVVDAVNEVLEIPVADIDLPSAVGCGRHGPFVGGRGHLGNGYVAILDLPRILIFDELTQLVDCPEV